MNWIFDHFQILALVGLALASWLKARADAKAAEREERRAREEMGETPGEIFGEEEDWQENQWPASPPPFGKAAPPPPLPEAVVLAAEESEAILKRQIEMQERLRQHRENKAVTSGGAAVTRARSRQGKSPAPARPAAVASVKSALRDRTQTRRAVLMREILGPPVGLR